MSYDRSSKQYREYALIQGINLLVNMVKDVKEDKTTLKKIHGAWMEAGILDFGDQIELIWGTSADGIRCRYLAHTINLLNSYMMSKHPNHMGLIRSLSTDVLNAINMAIYGNAHIWSTTQLKSIEAAFMTGRVSKTSPYYVPEEDEEKEKLEDKNKKKMLEYKY